jgi:hypothetical protein
MILGLLAMGVECRDYDFTPIIHDGKIDIVFARHLTNMGVILTLLFVSILSLNPEKLIKTDYSNTFKNTRIFSFNKTNKVALNNLLIKKYYDC